MKADMLAEVSGASALVVLALSMAYFTCVEHPHFLGDDKAKRLSLWCACLSMLTALMEFTRFVRHDSVGSAICGVIWLVTASVWMWLHRSGDGSDMDGSAK